MMIYMVLGCKNSKNDEIRKMFLYVFVEIRKMFLINFVNFRKISGLLAYAGFVHTD